MKRSANTIPVTERLAALGEMVRLRVLRLLEIEELSVGEVAQVVQLPQSTVSRHLKVLADGGWVARRNEGTATLYRLVMDDLAPEARALWCAVRDQLGPSSELDEDARRLRAVLDERKTDSQTFFGRVSGEWDALRNELFGTRFTSIAMLSLLPRDLVVADVGCGTGNAAELLAPVAGRVYAIDGSPAMLAAARRRLSEHRNVEFVESPIDRIPLHSGTVDVAVGVLVLHHLPKPVEALREMRRLLRASPNPGMALVVDMVRHDREIYKRSMGHVHLGFSREGMLGMLREAGFADGTYRELPGEAEAKGPGLFVAVGRV